MDDDQYEIEYKWSADKIDRDVFIEWAKSLNPSEAFKAKGPDYYYLNGEHVVRHRNGRKANEFAIKKRTHLRNTTVRAEVEVKLNKDVTVEEAALFWKTLDYKLDLVLVKDCYIFDYATKNGSVSMVVYDVECEGFDNARFIEVEPDKRLDIKTSKEILKEWAELLYKNTQLTDKDRLNDSLYEIYSGKKYAKLKL